MKKCDKVDVCICEPFVLPGILPTLAMPTLKTALKEKGIESKIYYASIVFFLSNNLQNDKNILQAIDNIPLQFSDFLFSSDNSESAIQCIASSLGIATDDEYIALKNDLRHLCLKAQKLIDDIVYEITSNAPTILCHSLTFGDYNFAFTLFKKIKRALPEIRIIVGGSNCTPAFSKTLMQTCKEIDYVICDEEFGYTIDLCEKILSQDVIEYSEFISSNSGYAKGVNKISSLDNLPCPDFSDFVSTADTLGLKREKAIVTYEISRGCWWSETLPCTMCGYFGHQKCFIGKSPEKVVSEINKIATTLGIKYFRLTDLVQPKHDYLKQLHKEKLNSDIHLFWELRPNLSVDDISLLRSLGLFYAQVGFESISTPQLKHINKGTTGIDNIYSLVSLGTFRVHVVWNYLYGFSDDQADWYINAMSIMPNLYHLQPPDAREIWINRNSLLFEKALPDELVPIGSGMFKNGLGKEFDVFFRVEQKEALIPVYNMLNESIEKWKAAFLSGYEFYVKNFDNNCVHLVRNYGTYSEIVLHGIDAALFCYFFEPHTLDEALLATGFIITEIKASLEKMVTNDWIIALDEKYLSLATRNTHYKWQRFSTLPD